MTLHHARRRRIIPLLLLGLALMGGLFLGLDRLVFHLLKRDVRLANVGRWNTPEWVMKQEVYRQRPEPGPQVLFLGDSTLSRDVRPSLISPAGFNFARSGMAGSELESFRERLVAQGLGRPKVVVISLLPEQFRGLDSDLAFLDQPPPSLGTILGHWYVKPHLSQLALLPGTRLVRYRFEGWVKGFQRDQTIRIDPDGSLLCKDDPSQDRLTPPFPGFMKNSPGYFDAERTALLERFVAHWKGQGARVVFVLLPLHPTLASAYESRFSPDRAAFRVCMERLGPVLDLENTMPVSDFFDATHLNAEGASKLSRLLRERLRSTLEEAGVPVVP